MGTGNWGPGTGKRRRKVGIALRSLVRAFAMIACAAPWASAQTIAITGGKVYPVSGPAIENGTVLIRDGKIVSVGAGIAVPNDARRVDATGKWVTPGLINALTGLGVSEVGAVQETVDRGARGENGIAASFPVWEGINPASTYPLTPPRTYGIELQYKFF